MQTQVLSTSYANTTTLPLHNGDKALIGNQYQKARQDDLFKLIDSELTSIKNFLRKKKRLSFDYTLTVDKDSGNKTQINIQVNRFTGVRGRKYPLFQTRYIQRWRDEKKPVSFFTNEFLFRNLDRAFSHEFIKLRLLLLKAVNKYNFIKLNKENVVYSQNYKVSLTLSESLISNEVGKQRTLNYTE